MTIADLKQFTPKNKAIKYTRIFVKLYNWKNRDQVHEIYEKIELKKMRILIAKNFCNLSAH